MPQNIVIDNGIAYIADELRLVLIDVSNPASPTQLSVLDFAQGDAAAVTATWGVAVSGNTTYVTHASFGLEAVDISKPGRPFKIGNYKSDTVRKVASISIGE